MSADHARLFFALNPDAQTRSGIARIQSALQLAARPVVVANIHMTLLFLGDVPAGRINRLQAIAAGLEFPECELIMDLTGKFKRSAVGWLGCSRVPDELLAFQSVLNQDVQAAGFRSEQRAWTPHITLYRDLRKPFETIEFEALRWKPRSFCLMQSRHDRSGLYYQSIGHWPARK